MGTSGSGHSGKVGVVGVEVATGGVRLGRRLGVVRVGGIGGGGAFSCRVDRAMGLRGVGGPGAC